MQTTTPSPKYQTPDLSGGSLNPEDFDFQLYTDGSGHTDEFAGCAVIGRSQKYKQAAHFAGAVASYGGNTARAEFEALLLGLYRILDIMDWEGGAARNNLEFKPATVYWLSDREDLVGSLRRGPDGEFYNGRHANKDLWARMAWYEKYFSITAVHEGRNKCAWQHLADQAASECRTMMKHYIEISRLENRIF